MANEGLPDEMASLSVNKDEEIWINLYPNALCNVRRALKTHLDERIGRFCSKNSGILLSYTDMKFRARHFQLFEDFPMCRFPVSVTATYYKPDPGTIATGTITRVDHISVTCLIHGMIHVTIALRKSVNFDTWCAPGQQIIFQIRGGEMHYKGVRLNAIVTEECVDRMRVAFSSQMTGYRKRTFSSSSADSSMMTPQKTMPISAKKLPAPSPEKAARGFSHKKTKKTARYDEHFAEEADDFQSEAYDDDSRFTPDDLDFGTPALTSTQLRPGKPTRYENFNGEEQDFSGPSDSDVPAAKRIKREYSPQEEMATPLHSTKRKSKRKKLNSAEDF